MQKRRFSKALCCQISPLKALINCGALWTRWRAVSLGGSSVEAATERMQLRTLSVSVEPDFGKLPSNSAALWSLPLFIMRWTWTSKAVHDITLITNHIVLSVMRFITWQRAHAHMRQRVQASGPREHVLLIELDYLLVKNSIFTHFLWSVA